MNNKKNQFRHITIHIPAMIQNTPFTESEILEYNLFCADCGRKSNKLIECCCCSHITCDKCIKNGKCDLCNS